MIAFSDYINEKNWYSFDYFGNLLLEITEEEAEAIQVKDGKWSSDYSTFYFNVEGDDGSDPHCAGFTGPLYKTTFYGDPNVINGVSVAFFRCNRVDDVRGGHGAKVFDAVKKSIAEYIKVKNPMGLTWSPVWRSSSSPVVGGVNNPEARKKVYELWAKKSLFPDKYVSVADNIWTRRDIYDKYIVPKGFPEIPAGLNSRSNPGEKAEAFKEFRRLAQSTRRSIHSVGSEVQQEIEQEKTEESREKAKEALSDREKNPNNIQPGDLVTIENPENASGKIASSWLYYNFLPSRFSDFLYAKVRPIGDNSSEPSPDFQNTYGHESFEPNQENWLIVRIDIFKKSDPSNSSQSVYYPIVDLKKINESDINQKKSEEIAKRRRERLERAAERDSERDRLTAHASSEDMQALINDPENPEKIKPGDHATIMTIDEARAVANGLGLVALFPMRPNQRLGGRNVIITGLWRNHEYEDSIFADFKVLRSTITGSTRVKLMKKDLSGTSQRAVNRSQVRRQIVSGESTGGRNIGDRTRVATGPHAGKRGIITGWRHVTGYIYANITTDATPSENIQVNVRLLEPVAGSPAVEQNNPWSFENFLLWRS